MANIKIALCEGRHEIPEAVDGAIFRSEIKDVTDTVHLEQSAFNGLWSAAFRRHKGGEAGFLTTDPDWDGSDMEPLRFAAGLSVDLYVTGLTVALIAALNVCRAEGISVTLWHFNRATGRYYPQQVR